VGDVVRVNSDEADVELGAVRGEGQEGVAVADALDGGDEGARGGSKGMSQRGKEENKSRRHA